MTDRRAGWAVFALLFVSYAYFYQGGGWNENSRFDLVRAIVEDHSLSIDRYHVNTGDKALFGGHYYSDKAPGTSFLAVPVYALVRLTRPAFAAEHDYVVVASYLTTLFTVGLAGAALGMLVFHAGRKLGASREGALIAALGYGLGTMAFPLSTMFFGHQIAALALFSAFLLAWKNRESESRVRALVVALLCASAVLVEFPTAPAAALIALYQSRARLTKRSWAFAAAAAVPVVALALYLSHAFGSPLRVGYDLLSDPASRAEMRSRGFFGLTFPRISVVVELLLGRYRGLLPYSPILFLSIPGYLGVLIPGDGASEVGAATDSGRKATAVALGVVVYFLLFVSSYAWWQGGSSFGSRHLAPMLPFLVLPITLVASRRPMLAATLAAVSVVVMTIVTSVQPKPSDQLTNPFWGAILPVFLRGHLADNDVCPMLGTISHASHQPFLRNAWGDAWNFGMLLGARGHRTLLPLVALWVTSAWAFARARREGGELAGDGTASPSRVTPRS